MNNEQKREQLRKLAWSVVESIRDSVGTELVNASQSTVINVKEQQLERLIAIVNGAIESGFQRSAKNFLNEADKLLKSDNEKMFEEMFVKKNPSGF